jgi:hypothetical protein
MNLTLGDAISSVGAKSLLGCSDPFPPLSDLASLWRFLPCQVVTSGLCFVLEHFLWMCPKALDFANGGSVKIPPSSSVATITPQASIAAQYQRHRASVTERVPLCQHKIKVWRDLLPLPLPRRMLVVSR